MFIFQIFMSAQ